MQRQSVFLPAELEAAPEAGGKSFQTWGLLLTAFEIVDDLCWKSGPSLLDEKRLYEVSLDPSALGRAVASAVTWLFSPGFPAALLSSPEGSQVLPKAPA